MKQDLMEITKTVFFIAENYDSLLKETQANKEKIEKVSNEITELTRENREKDVEIKKIREQ